MNEWWKHITPLTMLKWGAVVFAYALAILFIVSVILAMFGVYG